MFKMFPYRFLLLFITLSLFCLRPCHAQVIGEQVINGKYNELRRPKTMNVPTKSIEKEKFYRVKASLIRTPDLKQIKKNKAQKVIYGTSRQEYYFTGKLKRKDLARVNYSFELEGPIYYADTKTIYKTTELDASGDFLSETFYYKTGEISYVRINEDCPDCVRVIRYAKNGTITEAFTNKTFANVLVEEHPQRGTVNQTFWSKHPLKANVLRSGGNVYVGWPHIGELHTKTGYVLTGYHYPLSLEHGNASVLFLENVQTDSCFWSLIVDGRIRELVPASIEEKPDIEALYRSTPIESLNFKKLGTSDGKWKSKGSPQDKMKGSYEQEMVTMETKNIATHNGYGITLTNKDNQGAGDDVSLQVGFFRNGKLHGLGYKANLQYELGYTPKNTSLANLNGIDWKVDFGFFTNGEQSGGSGIFTERPYPTHLDVFSPTFDYRYKWAGRKAFSNVSEETIPFGQISKDFYFYLPSLKRKVKAQSIDYANKTITLFTDKEGEYVTFSTSDEIMAFKSDINSYRVSCPTVVTRPNYVQKNVPLFQYPPGYSTETRRVKGVYFDKIITTRTPTPGKIVYTEKEVQDGYKQVTCPKCEGQGFLEKSKQEGAYCKIDFER